MYIYIYKESEQVNITLALTANGNGASGLFEHLKLKQTPDPVDPPVLIHPLQASPFPFWRTWNSALTVAEYHQSLDQKRRKESFNHTGRSICMLEVKKSEITGFPSKR